MCSCFFRNFVSFHIGLIQLGGREEGRGEGGGREGGRREGGRGDGGGKEGGRGEGGREGKKHLEV